MDSQLSLLEWAPVAPARRKVRNSVAAAASLGEVLTPQAIAILKALLAAGERGLIRDEIERAAHLKTPAACGRCNWLETYGFVETETPGRPGVSGRMQKIYRLSERGRKQIERTN